MRFESAVADRPASFSPLFLDVLCQVGLVTYQNRIGQFASVAAGGLPGVSTAFYDNPYPGVMGIWNTWS